MTQAAIGFRVKSGWATAVLVTGPPTAPQVVDRAIVTLSDPAVRGSRQPYHAGFGVAQTDSATLRRLVAAIRRYTRRSVAQLVSRYRKAGHQLRGVGIVVGSTIDPERIANDHIRAHASEGRLFRTVVEDGARRCALKATVFVERELFPFAAGMLRRTEPALRRAATELGESLDGPWRLEEKAATVAAWLVLAKRTSRGS